MIVNFKLRKADREITRTSPFVRQSLSTSTVRLEAEFRCVIRLFVLDRVRQRTPQRMEVPTLDGDRGKSYVACPSLDNFLVSEMDAGPGDE